MNGLVDGKYKVSVTVNVIDQLGGLMNYSATTPKGTELNLPTTRPAIAQDGTVLNVSFPVTWGKVDKTKYDEPGIVTVNGTSNVWELQWKLQHRFVYKKRRMRLLGQ